MGVIDAGMLGRLIAMPPGAARIPLPPQPITPQIGSANARGRCAIVQALDLDFVAMTADEGKSWRFALPGPAPRSPDWWTGLHCEGDTFLAVTNTGVVARPSGDGWQIVIPDGGTFESTYRGLEAIGGLLYLGTGRRTWISADRGATWRPWLAGIDALTTDGKRVFVAVGRDVRRAEPGADQAAPIGSLPEPLTALGFDGGTLYAGTEAGVYRSRNGGASWDKVRAPPEPLPAGPSRFTFAGGATFVHFQGYRVKALAGDEWQAHDDYWSILPAATGFWLRTDGNFAHVRSLDEKKPPHIAFADNPFPTVRAIGASGAKLVASVHHIDGVLASANGGRDWQQLCKTQSFRPKIATDGDRLQLAPGYPAYERRCDVPGFKMRVVQVLPLESCSGERCVRWREARLLRTRDRGRTWDDLTGKLPNQARGRDIVAVAVAGREILLGVRHPERHGSSAIDAEMELWRSVDDGASFAPWDVGEAVTAFAPGPDGWYLGTAYRGLWRVPFSAAAP